jgi:hypothetical protein
MQSMSGFLIAEAWMPTCIAARLGDAHLVLGDAPAALKTYDDALGLARRVRFRPEVALIRLDLAELLLDHYPGERDAAIEHLDFAIAEFQDMKMQPALERALRHRGLLRRRSAWLHNASSFRSGQIALEEQLACYPADQLRSGAIMLTFPTLPSLTTDGKKSPELSSSDELKRWVFARHSNPWSAWTRWLSTPLVLVPLWTRRWSHAAIVGAWMAANPVVFPKPADEQAWSTRAVLGEELWITERPHDSAMAVDAAATAAGIVALIAAWRHNAGLAAGATAIVMALLLVYWRLMARYYDRHRSANPL